MGHPIEIMDMSFALQALCIEHLIKNGNSLEKKLYPVPRSIDIAIAGEKLETLGTNIDCLTDKQNALQHNGRAVTGRTFQNTAPNARFACRVDSMFIDT